MANTVNNVLMGEEKRLALTQPTTPTVDAGGGKSG
jgi:hypothetical protein